MSYQDTLPAWEYARWENGLPIVSQTGAARWSGTEPPPHVGEEIFVTMNNCGNAIVTGYFVERNYLGVVCDLINAPEWLIEQNNGDTRGYVFGAEMRSTHNQE